MCAVREGNVERVRELIDSFGLSYSQPWLEGYVLLCISVAKKRTQVAKLLLTFGLKVKITWISSLHLGCEVFLL